MADKQKVKDPKPRKFKNGGGWVRPVPAPISEEQRLLNEAHSNAYWNSVHRVERIQQVLRGKAR